MNLLALDTSTDKASVAVSQGTVIRSLEQNSIRQHAQQLLPMVQTLLQDTGQSLAELDGIVFGSGPGSFTGLRIACSIAKGLAYAHNLPMFGVCSLDAIAHQVTTAAHQGILAILDARMQEVYWAYYPPGSKVPDLEVRVTSPESVTLPVDQEVVMAGWGLDAYQMQWSPAVTAAVIEQIVVAPSAESLIQLVQLGHIPSTSIADALPIYVRNQVAQIGAKHG